MNADGTSARSDIYTKERGVIDELPDGENIYKSFIAKMDGLKTAGTINDWEPVAYDWRLSLDDILNYGNDVNGRIYYSGDLRATSTPYVIQELRRLAASSKTGKVTIVAHSNGGLVTKRLTQLLGPEASQLIDKIIFVAVPQAGTPAAVAGGLHGYDQDHAGGFAETMSTGRTLAQNAPAEYNLLPSAQYFTQVDNPVASFDYSLPDWISRYGSVIHSQSSLHQFLTDSYGRVDPQTGDIDQPIQLNNALLTSAEALHASLDAWVPPAGVSLVQIAGWGVPKTVAGVHYSNLGIQYSNNSNAVRPDPDFTIDGDGTVVVPSALWTSTTTGAQNYWVDLEKYNKTFNKIAHGTLISFDHGSILELDGLEQFISDVVTGIVKPLEQYSYLSTTAPHSNDPRLRYALHSPLTLNLYDSQGRHTGVSTTTGRVEEQIPGTYYTEFGDVKYLFTDASTTARVVMNGYAPGTFTLNVDQYSGNTPIASTTFKDVPTTPSTTVTLGVQSDISTLSNMNVDANSDGITDFTLAPKLGGTVTLDTTPPELRFAFSTSTIALTISATDDSGAASLVSTTTYPALKKNQKNYQGTATTTVTARDGAGNSTKLIYTELLPSPAQRDTITPLALVYNGATTTLANSLISYKWRVATSTYSLFAANLHNATTTLESHWRPKKAKTIIMLKPQDLDDTDTDDAVDVRPTKITLPGMVIPYIVTQKGSIVIGY
jgi:pimeloyl-ACP methyl ester carboxylesterase